MAPGKSVPDQDNVAREQNSGEQNPQRINSELAQAFQELARGEQQATALEGRLTEIEGRIEQLLASVEQNARENTATVSGSDPSAKAESKPMQ
ncbi:uncharacterized protein AB675_3370 [Cyphellophora attinorum]|uniref:Uncharacterized protein n=1 Tax=Cyphellophora attinorum TaxID=1664694 RepID=A0A0N1H3P7_9EURO|nr:uncharacterized protein AB675_3370 [Phialophora attinorum]KPI39693.1 hypothetical protein AB675_3370 [Phialophora attinorum]